MPEQDSGMNEKLSEEPADFEGHNLDTERVHETEYPYGPGWHRKIQYWAGVVTRTMLFLMLSGVIVFIFVSTLPEWLVSERGFEAWLTTTAGFSMTFVVIFVLSIVGAKSAQIAEKKGWQKIHAFVGAIALLPVLAIIYGSGVFGDATIFVFLVTFPVAIPLFYCWIADTKLVLPTRKPKNP